MPTEIMDSYLNDLTPAERNFIALTIHPFSYTAMSFAEAEFQKTFLRREITVGALGTLEIEGLTEDELDVQERNIRANEDNIITFVADEDFEELLMPEEERICSLPNIAELRTLHKQHPAFGPIIGLHDRECRLCAFNTDEEFDRMEQDRIDEIALLGPEEQTLLVALAERLLDRITTDLPPDQLAFLELGEDPVLLLAELSDVEWRPFLVRSLSDAELLWMSKHPYFFQELLFHSNYCPELKALLLRFEQAMVGALPADLQGIYGDAAFLLNFLLRGGESRRLFS